MGTKTKAEQRVRHCDFYSYTPDADDYDAWEWVHSCCGGPWLERPFGHYADCPSRLT